MLEWIGLAAGIGFGIMGLGAYLKTNRESKQREQEYQQRLKELEGIIAKGQKIEFERLILEQKKLIRSAQNCVWLLGINALGVFHEQREDIISLLRQDGSVKALLLNPQSEAFKMRVSKEGEINVKLSGRLQAEYKASIAICKDIINFAKGKGTFELRLHEKDITEALLIVDPGSDRCKIHVNRYPPEKSTRGVHW